MNISPSLFKSVSALWGLTLMVIRSAFKHRNVSDADGAQARQEVDRIKSHDAETSEGERHNASSMLYVLNIHLL